MRLLVIGNVGFDRMAPHLQARGIETVLVSISGETNHAHLAERFLIYESDEYAPLVDLAVKARVEAVISISGPDPMNLRDAHVKETLERDHSIPVLANPVKAAEIAVDKAETKKWLRRNGFPTGDGCVVESEREALDAAESLGYPLVLKRLTDSGGLGLIVIRDRDALKRATRPIGPMLLEEYLTGPEFSVEVLNYADKAVALPPVYKGVTEPHGLHPMERVKLAPAPIDPVDQAYIRRLAKHIVTDLGLQPTADVDIVWTETGPKVLEINPRFGGVTALSMAASGICVYEALVDMITGRWEIERPRAGRALAADIPIRAGVSVPTLSSMLEHDGVFRIKMQKLRRTDGRIALRAKTPSDLLKLVKMIVGASASDFCSYDELSELLALSAC